MNESKKIAGALGFYTDFISASSQTRCKPVLDELFNIICASNLTQREARCIATALHCMISDEIDESEKTMPFNSKPIITKKGG